MSQIKLTCVDGAEVVLDRSVLLLSQTIKNMVEHLDEENANIPLPNIRGDTMNKVASYLKYHATATTEGIDVGAVKKWDDDYIAIEQAPLFELILAANYLDVKALLDLTCQKVADMIKGKSPEEIRTLFNIPNDFTPEEEEQVRKENEWCEEK
jgi:S-phase kinase-associated protein 1